MIIHVIYYLICGVVIHPEPNFNGGFVSDGEFYTPFLRVWLLIRVLRSPMV